MKRIISKVVNAMNKIKYINTQESCSGRSTLAGMVSEGLLKEVIFKGKLNDHKEPAMRYTKETMSTNKLRLELIWIISKTKIIVVCLDRKTQGRSWNALKSRARSLDVTKTRCSKFSGKLLETFKLRAS